MTFNTESALDDLAALKDQMAADKKLFVKNIAEVDERLLEQQRVLREDMTTLEKR